MREEIISIKNQALGRIFDSKSEELEEIRIEYLGKKGRLSKLTKKLSKLPKEEKASFGKLLNEVKSTINTALAEKKGQVEKPEKTVIDLTIPGTIPQIGSKHLISQTIDEVSQIFERIGFNRVRYPEVEWDWYVFGALNFNDEHPARDEWETFFIDAKPDSKYGPMLLTPHTSNGQVREMLRVGQPPVRMINIGKCYRRQSDVTHFPMFHQFEGLVIDKNINITHLKGTIDYFAKSFYGENAVSRIRPYNFPFTEPSFEVDFSCVHCGGKGCKFCKAGWHEVGGAGMVHPNVLKSGGIDPKKYSGFAFGWGVERTLLLRDNLGINDIRTLYKTNLEYLNQY